MYIKKCLSMIVVLVLVLTVFSGCSPKGAEPVADTSAEQPTESGDKLAKDQVLNVVLAEEPTSLDAVKGSDNASFAVINQVIEPLVRNVQQENGSLEMTPAGAEKWESNADGTVWTFHLRDFNWSDGQPVKAQDYEYAIKRFADPKSAAPSAYLISSVKNCLKVNKGELPVDQLGVKALDDRTLEITLESPTAYFLEIMCTRPMYPLRKDVVEKHGDKYGTEIDTLVYCGPFVIESWTHNSGLVLKKNPSYWDKDVVKLETVNFKIIADVNARYNSLDSGDLDSLGVRKPEWIERFSSREDMTKLSINSPATYFDFYNQKDELMKNVNIRKAFILSFDRDDMCKVVYSGANEAGYGFVPKGIQIDGKDYRNMVEEPLLALKAENPDPKALLIKGLQELGKDTDPSKLTIKILLPSTDQWSRTYGEYYQQVCKKVLGVNIEPEMVEWPVFNDRIYSYDYQIACGYVWSADYNDPLTFLGAIKSDLNTIPIGWSNAEYDRLISEAEKTIDQAKRLEFFKAAEKIAIYDEGVICPLQYESSIAFRYKKVMGMSTAFFATQGYKYIYITENQ